MCVGVCVCLIQTSEYPLYTYNNISGVSKESPRPIESVMLNVSGKLLMLQQDLPNPYAEQQEVCHPQLGHALNPFR